ncbi:MAG: hypothetical protein KF842_10095 [Caulobacter sp.]|nr:hypothetical protein [Caulobacter sp.]
MLIRSGILVALMLPLAACGPTSPSGPAPAEDRTATASDPEIPTAPAATDPAPAAPAAPVGLIACATQIGVGPARTLADQCRQVSPATRPPCHIANSCALIRDEIARSCSLLGPDAAAAGCPVDPGGAQAATDVVSRYYEALNARDYATAYSQWRGDGEASGKSYADFSAGFAATRSTSVTLGRPGEIEGAAGSLYVTVPVTVDAVLNDGTRQRFVGEYSLRRVNGVDGATPEQLRWKLASASLRASS